MGRVVCDADIAYVKAGAATGWVLALVLALATRPLYPAYASLSHRWAGLSAVVDQQLAAGIIGIGSIQFTIAVFVLLYRWLDEAPRRLRREALGVGVEDAAGDAMREPGDADEGADDEDRRDQVEHEGRCHASSKPPRARRDLKRR
jgi:Cytochrome c oxidase caa3 assembly factor (Caa3_CtaG)